MSHTSVRSGRAWAFLLSGLALIAALPLRALAQTPILLWPSGAPGAKGTADADKPTITPYPSSKPNGAAMIIFPGGGYSTLSMVSEGANPALWFNKAGVTCFVVKYRLGSAGYRHPIEMWDGQRALRWVRAHAKEYGIDPARVGVLGFSAGGHMAATVSTHYDSGHAGAADTIDRKSCRPDFSLLGYAVITMDSTFTHMGSRRNLLGNTPTQTMVDSLSNEKQVTSKTPPAFLFHAKPDVTVPYKNSQVYYDSLVRRGVAAELKLYEKGGHGFGLADGVGTPKDSVLATWPALASAWLDKQGFYKQATSILPASPKAAMPVRSGGAGLRYQYRNLRMSDAMGRRLRP